MPRRAIVVQPETENRAKKWIPHLRNMPLEREAKQARPTGRSLRILVQAINVLTKSHIKGKVPIYPSFQTVRSCIVRTAKPFSAKGRVGLKIKVYDPNGSGSLHTVHIYQIKDGTETELLSKAARPLLTCDCGHWVYTCEAAMFKHKYAELLRANDIHAPVTNPRLRPVCCKHVMRAIAYVLKEKL